MVFPAKIFSGLIHWFSKKSMDRGPTNKPIMINGKIAGIRILQAIHWARIPKTIIAASSNIIMLFAKNTK